MSEKQVVWLDPITPEMKNMLFEWRNEPNVMDWCRQPVTLDWNSHIRWMERLGTDPTIKMWAIVAPPESLFTGTGEPFLVGVCGLTDISHLHQRAEFSLYIGPEYQGKGYGKSALRELLCQGFLNLNLNVIWGETFDGNPAARMFEAIGFVKEGTRRDFYFKGGRFIDAHLYSLRRAEWTSSR